MFVLMMLDIFGGHGHSHEIPDNHGHSHDIHVSDVKHDHSDCPRLSDVHDDHEIKTDKVVTETPVQDSNNIQNKRPYCCACTLLLCNAVHPSEIEKTSKSLIISQFKQFLLLFKGAGLMIFLANLIHKLADGLVIGAGNLKI